MRIAFCIFKYFPHGGIPRDLLKLARECRARGHSVRIYAGLWQGDRPADVDIVEVPVTALANHIRYRRYAAWVHQHLRQAPVDLLVGMNKMPGLDVYYAGDSCYEEKARTQRGMLYRLTGRYRLFARFERAVFDPSVDTEILTISDAQVPYFRRHYGTPPERFHPLPPGIDPDRRAGADSGRLRAAFRAEHRLGDDDLLLLFLGSGFIKKGLDRALLAVHALPPELSRRTRLFVVGHDNDEPFRRMARRLGIDRQVTFFAGRDDVSRFLFGADGLVLPAYDENAGMVILEAMIAGLPALVTANCGYAHYLCQSDAGLVADLPYDQERFNAQLQMLLTSPERPRWRRNGLAFGQDPAIYRLSEAAVDHFEAAAARHPPRVAFVLFKYFPYGGLQRDFLRVAETCLARGLRVRVYTLDWEGPVPDGIELVKVSVNGWRNTVRYRRFAEWVRRDLAWRPVACVVGYNKLPGLDLYYAADPCFEEKAREQRGGHYRWMPRYRLFSRFERAVFDPAAATRIMLIGPRQQHSFQRYYGTPAERFTLLPPGVSRDRQHGDDAAAVRAGMRSEFGVGDDELLVLFLGSGFITKGLDRALLAVAALPLALRRRVRLFVVGQDSPERFLDLAEGLGIANQLTIFSGRDDVPRFLQGADLLLHPAYMESGGIVLLEAIIAGLPVITTDVCGFAPYVVEAEAGRVLDSPFQQRALNEVLHDALTDPGRRACWARNGIAFGRRADLFSMPERAADLIEEHARGATVSA